MKFSLNLNAKEYTLSDVLLVAAYSKTEKKGKKEETKVVASWGKELKASFESVRSSADFKGGKGETFTFVHEGFEVIAIGLGEKSKLTMEELRKELAKSYKLISKFKTASIALDTFTFKGRHEATIECLVEAYGMTAYKFTTYLKDSKADKLSEITIDTKEKGAKKKKFEAAILEGEIKSSAVNLARDYVNEPPNILRSTEYSKRIKADASKIKGVKVKVLGRTELKKEKMNMFLSVNDGSAYDAQMVHLTYTPKKVTKNTKHIALVGKGLVFDTGGYSLKPGGSMMNMKFDMAGSATVYGAFRAAAMLGVDAKITCILGITDNAINSKATMPDSIVTARNGKTVEIHNTDAEGRLVLGDCIDYACDLKPDAVIDVATLTGACLIALGTEVCGLMTNDDKLALKLLKSAKNADEYMWQLPIIPEWEKDMKGTISDLTNIGKSRWGGTAKAAAFLQEFVQDGVSWAHLDIAGVGDSQSHLPYCPAKGASGIVIRTLVDFIKSK